MLRAFRTTFICAIDASEITQDDRPEELAEPSLEEVKAHLRDALIVGFNDEQYGNPVGLQSVEVHIEQLQELPEAEVARLYGGK